MKNIMIDGTGAYIPTNKVYNEQLDEHFEKRGLSAHNCTGMVQGLDIVYKYMQASDIKRALVVGCFCITPIALWSDTVVYATFADAAACVALGMDESSEKRGFIDTIVSVDASYHDYIKYPKCGMAKVPLQAVMPNEKDWNGIRFLWILFQVNGQTQ